MRFISYIYSYLNYYFFFSDYPHGDKPLDEMDDKYPRIPPIMPQYRPSKIISF